MYWIGLNKLNSDKTWKWLDEQTAQKNETHWVDQAPDAREANTWTQRWYSCGLILSDEESPAKYLKTDNWHACHENVAYALCEKKNGKLFIFS